MGLQIHKKAVSVPLDLRSTLDLGFYTTKVTKGFKTVVIVFVGSGTCFHWIFIYILSGPVYNHRSSVSLTSPQTSTHYRHLDTFVVNCTY